MFKFDSPDFSDKEIVVIYFKEYDTLRTEIIGINTLYGQIFTVLATVIAGLVLVASQNLNNTNFFHNTLYAIAAAVLFALLAFAFIMKRQLAVGAYVAELEKRINLLAGTSLEWEGRRRPSKR